MSHPVQDMAFEEDYVNWGVLAVGALEELRDPFQKSSSSEFETLNILPPKSRQKLEGSWEAELCMGH